MRQPPLKVCIGCGNAYTPTHARQSRCQDCGPSPKPSTPAMAARQRIYKNKRWQTARRIVLNRDDHTCVACDATEDLVVDHIGGIDYTDPYNPDHLRTLCRSCSGRADAPRATGGHPKQPNTHPHPAVRPPIVVACFRGEG
jgi:5-methylcytosine-specific restriction endonuclease McrA